MFTLTQLKEAHSRVKTGADFPRYVQEIKKLGLRRYEFMVINGQTNYYGDTGHQVHSLVMYTDKVISGKASIPALQHTIAIHQQGQTDFLAFCTQAAEAGVEKWVIDTEKMLCSYYDLAGNEMVAEAIPQGEYE